jgi:hypothetical protein
METEVYRFSGHFHRLLFVQEHGVEPLLVVDRIPAESPQRVFLVRYVISQGGENGRPIFMGELTGYDYELKLTFPTQRSHLEALQSTLEHSMYGSSEARLLRATIENLSTKDQRIIKAVVSESLVTKLVAMYLCAWGADSKI